MRGKFAHQLLFFKPQYACPQPYGGCIVTRDPLLEARLPDDLGQPDLVTSRPMFGGVCFMLNGHMLCASRKGRAMFRVGKAAEQMALSFSKTERMHQKQREMPGYVWLHDPLADDSARQNLAQLAIAYVSTLPPKEHPC